jgi:hypothetical protein
MSETEELKRIGAVPQPNSGRGKHKKGDGVLDEKYLVDVKESAKSFTLNTTVWGKICTDASKSNYEPVLLVVLGDEGQPRKRLVVMSEDEFAELREKAAAFEDSLLNDKDWRFDG